MNFIQCIFQVGEGGAGQLMARLLPLFTALLLVGGAYDAVVFHGLNDAQSMDNAQLARQIVRKQGFTTEFLRPQAVAQLRDYTTSQSLKTGASRDLFPSDRFPFGTPRVLPDTYNAPGYPYLLATWFYFIHPEFDQSTTSMTTARMYAPDRWIPYLNQIFMFLTAVLVFALGRRLFSDRVAWFSLLAFLGTDLAWHYTVTALSTSVLMFLVTAMLMCILEVYCISEECFVHEERSFAPAWLWGFAAALLLAAACLTRLHLLVLLIPLLVLLVLMPKPSFLLFVAIALVVIGLVTPWFLHVNAISGNPLGSNSALLIYGQGGYTENQIYCTTSIPIYEHIFGSATKKEYSGFGWHLEHAWTMLGTNPLILLFGASILHQFKRRGPQALNWLLLGCAIAIVVANNLGTATPDAVGPWNTLIVLLPGMLVLGGAFFFVLLDRLNIQIELLKTIIVIATLALTSLPMVLTLTGSNSTYGNFPPYWPPAIKVFGQLTRPDEWMTTDMPWATAWYGDRASLWLPDSISDFESLHDNVCPTGILLLTPVSWSQPVSTFWTGEYKDWSPLAMGFPLPQNFPLPSMISQKGLEYRVWSDRARWNEK
jgi:4-amino-4-deoxy-L-arabinose transferase-like glycosyltransferase